MSDTVEQEFEREWEARSDDERVAAHRGFIVAWALQQEKIDALESELAALSAVTYVVRGSAEEPCHSCAKATRRRVKFGPCAFYVPCCWRCDGE